MKKTILCSVINMKKLKSLLMAILYFSYLQSNRLIPCYICYLLIYYNHKLISQLYILNTYTIIYFIIFEIYIENILFITIS